MLPSANVLETMARSHRNSFIDFVRARSETTRAALLALPFSADEQARFERATLDSIKAQKQIEATDTMPFEIYREQYVSPARLGFRKHWIDAPHMVSQPAAL
jgi:glutamate--cysteine ligase